MARMRDRRTARRDGYPDVDLAGAGRGRRRSAGAPSRGARDGRLSISCAEEAGGARGSRGPVEAGSGSEAVGPAVRRRGRACLRGEGAAGGPAPSGSFRATTRGTPATRAEGFTWRRERRRPLGACRAVLTGRSELVGARRLRLPMCKRFRCLWMPAVECAAQPAPENSTVYAQIRHSVMSLKTFCGKISAY
jgi:hypothetical protein